jgi:UDP-glucose 4-epimerase
VLTGLGRYHYFNAAGDEETGEIGQDHSPETHLVPLVLETASGLRSNIQV